MQALSQHVTHEADEFPPDLRRVVPKNSLLLFYLDLASELHYQLVVWLSKNILACYAMASFLVGAALLLRWLLSFWLQDHAPFTALYVPVAVAAWYCGIRPVLVAALPGLIAADYWFVDPVGSLYIADEARLVELTIFMVSLVVFVMMAQTNRRNLQALMVSRERLEERVAQRTAEVDRANVRVKEQAETLESANRRLSSFAAELLRAQDEERRRIARDLHDSTGQNLACLTIDLAVLKRKMNKVSPELDRLLAESIGLARQVSADLRTTSYLLHPPMLDEMGLVPALRWYLEGLRTRSQIKVTLHLENDLGRLPMNCETAIFRIVQAALTNIQLYSGSETAVIHIRKSVEWVMMTIKDEGKGIPAEKLSRLVESTGAHGLGLRGMRERVEDLGGKFEIASSARGTTLTVIIPDVRP